MKRVLVIGGTQTFGKEIALAYQSQGFATDVIGRTKPNFETNKSYRLDLSKIENRKAIFKTILDQENYNIIFCTVGYARAQQFSDSNKAWELNVGYVNDILDLAKESQSIERIITIGSRHTFLGEKSSLPDYANAKSQLLKLALNFARQSHIISNHYCVPPIQTQQLAKVLASLQKVGEPTLPGYKTVQDPKRIAQALVAYDLQQNESGLVIRITNEFNFERLFL